MSFYYRVVRTFIALEINAPPSVTATTINAALALLSLVCARSKDWKMTLRNGITPDLSAEYLIVIQNLHEEIASNFMRTKVPFEPTVANQGKANSN